jgi:hypothetical protein
MTKTKTIALSTLLGSSLLAGCAAQADVNASVNAPPPPPPPQVQVEGQVDVQAEPTDVAPAPEATDEPEELVATSEPPEPIYEEQDDGGGPGMVWVGGYWEWTGNDWVWFYGRWAPAPEGRIYIEPYYEHVDGHVVYVRGYWGVEGRPPRYYGGERIVFTAAVRPEGYVRGQHVAVAASVGLAPGARAGHYGPAPAGATARALPAATAPRKAVRRRRATPEEGHAQPGHAASKPRPRSAPPAPAPRRHGR